MDEDLRSYVRLRFEKGDARADIYCRRGKIWNHIHEWEARGYEWTEGPCKKPKKGSD